MTKEKFFTSMGWIGMVTSVLMYVFYFPQIENNLAGQVISLMPMNILPYNGFCKFKLLVIQLFRNLCSYLAK